MEWNGLETCMVIVVGLLLFVINKMEKLDREVTLLKSSVSNIKIQVPHWEAGVDSTLLQRIESLEYQIFGASGNKIDYEHNRLLSSRLRHLEDRLEAGARWLKLEITDDESKTELDNVTYCIRSAAYQMLKKPE